MNFEPLSKKYDAIASAIVIAAYSVHKELGPGLLVSNSCCAHVASFPWKSGGGGEAPTPYFQGDSL